MTVITDTIIKTLLTVGLVSNGASHFSAATLLSSSRFSLPFHKHRAIMNHGFREREKVASAFNLREGG
jgi:hypothetical protein